MATPLCFDERFDFIGQCLKMIDNAIELFSEINCKEGEVQCKKIRGLLNDYKDQICQNPKAIKSNEYSTLLFDDNSILLGKDNFYFVEVVLSDEAEEQLNDK